MIYQILIFLLSAVPVNKNFEQDPQGIEIFVGTNNVHTELVLPVKNELFDWSQLIPFGHFYGVDSTFQHLAVGWGDKGFYIETPTWEDLTADVALKALFLPTRAALHVTYMPRPPRGSIYYTQLFISNDQYKKLINYILPYFRTDEKGGIILIEEAPFFYNENYYEALDRYTMFNTSNNWTNRALRKSGIRTVLWSPLDAPIMIQLNRIKPTGAVTRPR